MTTAAEPSREQGLLTVAQTAAYLGLSRSAVFEMRQAQFIPDSVRIGGKVLWRKDELRAWISAGCPNCNAWRWEPHSVVRLELYKASLVKDINRLQSDLKDVEAAIARGEQTLAVRVRH